MRVPFFRVDLTDAEIEAVERVLRSGWLTTGESCRQFEQAFAEAVGARHAIALNSCTAALHLAVDALELRSEEAVLVPTMTFAASAEVVRYMGATPILVDCEPDSLNIDWRDAETKIERARSGDLGNGEPLRVVGMIPVHVGGRMIDLDRLRAFRDGHGVWSVEDAAHAFPAAWRSGANGDWQTCGGGPSEVTCYSFYANKTITTGEGGMAVTDDEGLASRMRLMSLHGLNNDAWQRFRDGGSWNYKIVAPGFKYNLTDIAAALGIEQLRRAEELRAARERLALGYVERFADVEELDLPPVDEQHRHAWHIFPVRLRLDLLRVDRNEFIEHLSAAGIGTTVHWRPLHRHPYYRQTYPWQTDGCPVADATWVRVVTLPLFPSMTDAEQDHVVTTVRELCRKHHR